MPEKNKIEYVQTKETKGTYVFAPLRGVDDPAGLATIYLKKEFCKSIGLDPLKGFTMSIEVK